MSFAAIIANTAAVVTDAGFRHADNRKPIEQQAEQGRDRLFQIDATPVSEVIPWLAISHNRRATQLTVKAAYYRGGGDAGGENGGDRVAVSARATTDMLRLAAFLENPNRYNSAATGINRIVDWSFRKTVDAETSEVWELTARCEWEEALNVRAVQS